MDPKQSRWPGNTGLLKLGRTEEPEHELRKEFRGTETRRGDSRVTNVQERNVKEQGALVSNLM